VLPVTTACPFSFVLMVTLTLSAFLVVVTDGHSGTFRFLFVTVDRSVGQSARRRLLVYLYRLLLLWWRLTPVFPVQFIALVAFRIPRTPTFSFLWRWFAPLLRSELHSGNAFSSSPCSGASGTPAIVVRIFASYRWLRKHCRFL
jgi:hypothetical protein